MSCQNSPGGDRLRRNILWGGITKLQIVAWSYILTINLHTMQVLSFRKKKKLITSPSAGPIYDETTVEKQDSCFGKRGVCQILIWIVKSSLGFAISHEFTVPFYGWVNEGWIWAVLAVFLALCVTWASAEHKIQWKIPPCALCCWEFRLCWLI